MTALFSELRQAWELVSAIEPIPEDAAGRMAEVRAAVADAIAATAASTLTADERAEADAGVVTLLGRAAALAIATGDAIADDWLAQAERLTSDARLRARFAAGRVTPERYRALVHGRYHMARGRERSALALWRKLADERPRDAIGRAAVDERNGPRPLKGAPMLGRLNGFGCAFYGERDVDVDGTYVTTHCVSALFLPVLPLGAYRVARAGADGYHILAREPLSRFAKTARIAVAAALVLGVSGAAIASYLRDPDRLARGRFDDALELAQAGDREAALRSLDGELAGEDLARVGDDRATQAGAAIVRLTAGYLPKPFTRAELDQATRVVSRYLALPPRAQGGVARDAMIEALDGWVGALASPGDLAARLALVRREAEVADAARRDAMIARLRETRREFARATAATAPVEAVVVLIEDPDDREAIAQATALLAVLAEQPSLLEDNRAEVEAWMAAVPAADPVRARVEAQLAVAIAGRAEAEAEAVTPAQLAAMQRARPWDQRVALRLVGAELDAGKLDAAAARLRGFGPPARLVRDARLLLGQIAMAQGHAEEADQLVSELVTARLPRFLVAASAFEVAQRAFGTRMEDALRTGALPSDVLAKLERASRDEQDAIVQAWVDQHREADPALVRARADLQAVADLLPQAIAAGSIKLRRAQALSGAERDAMLAAAEQLFLAVKAQAEGQPEFHLGLAEIDARLGKHEASEAELATLLAKQDPELSLRVVDVYRNIGSEARAIQVATEVYDTAASPLKERAAALLGVLTSDDDEISEGWYRKSDPRAPDIQASLLQIEGLRQRRRGESAACNDTFARVAKIHLASARAGDRAGYNNAAVALQLRFGCGGDFGALREAEAAMTTAYRASGDDPIVVGNLAGILASNADLRVLARRIDVTRLQLDASDATAVLNVLLDGATRGAVLADLTADPGTRRSAELAAHYEVLAPNASEPYRRALTRATRMRDEAAAAAVIERLRRATHLDTSGARERRARNERGEFDARGRQALDTAIGSFDRVLAGPRLATRDRAVATYLRARARAQRGILVGDAVAIAQAIDELATVPGLWPELPTDGVIAHLLLDQAGLEADAARWGKLRRDTAAAAVLSALIASSDPLATAIRASKPWAKILDHARADTTPPGIGDLRLAQALGDPAVLARARTVRQDKLARAWLEFEALTDPCDTSRADLAYLDAQR